MDYELKVTLLGETQLPSLDTHFARWETGYFMLNSSQLMTRIAQRGQIDFILIFFFSPTPNLSDRGSGMKLDTESSIEL